MAAISAGRALPDGRQSDLRQAHLRQAHLRQAETRVLRTVLMIFGVSTLVFLALTMGGILDEAAYLHPVWNVFAVCITFGFPPALAVIGFLLPLPVLRRLIAAYAVAALAITLSFVPAMTTFPMPVALSPWPLTIVALSTVPAALAFRAPVAWAVLVVHSIAVAVIRIMVATPVDVAIALQDGMYTLVFSGIFTALAIVTMNSARALDHAAAVARATAVRTAAAESSQREQARLDALLHDDVMSTLFYASTGTPELDAAVRRQAIHALAELSRVDSAHAEPVDVPAFTSRIRSVALQGSGAVSFEVRGTRSSPVPSQVDAAFAEAAAEAVRNSVQHAGRGGQTVTRTTTVVLDERSIRVLIEDDGVGFEARDVRPHRLGILVSIRGRMSAVPGGSARVESSAGRGVLVELEWVGA